MKRILRQILVAGVFLLGTAVGIFAQFTCGDTLVDTRDGKKYATVLIGNQCWMKQSLNYGAFTISVSTSTLHADMKNNGLVGKILLFQRQHQMCALWCALRME